MHSAGLADRNISNIKALIRSEMVSLSFALASI